MLPTTEPSVVQTFNTSREEEYELSCKTQRKPVVKIAALYGGGTRGIFSARFLQEIEARTNQKAAELFDIFTGASIGGLIATVLNKPSPEDPAKPQYPASELVHMFITKSQVIFPKPGFFSKPWRLIDPEYSRKGLHDIVSKYVGDMLFKDCIKHVCVPSGETTMGKPWWFTKTKVIAPEGYDPVTKEEFNKIKALDVIEATTAAPTYFPAKQFKIGGNAYQFIDGGTFSNNPSRRALVVAADIYGADAIYGKYSQPVIATFGTGEAPQGLDAKKAGKGGELYWASNFPTETLSMTSDDIDNEMYCLFPEQGEKRKLFFFQPKISIADSALDEGTEAHMKHLLEIANMYVEDHDEEFRLISQRLEAESGAEVCPAVEK